MSLQRTPPNKFLSDGDLSKCDEQIDYTYSRKRKVPHDPDMSELFGIFEERLKQQMVLWNTNINECISNCVATAVSSAMSTELSKISTLLSDINNNIVKLKAENIKINNSITLFNNRLNEFEKSLNFSSDRLDEFDTRIKSLESGTKTSVDCEGKISVLENKILNMEQQARDCNIEISNLPERRSENLLSILECLGNEIKHPIRSTDIVAIHRVPHGDQKDRRPKNIVVKFTSKLKRDNVLAACRTMKGLDSARLSVSGSPNSVYINEHLTLHYKLLFRRCREVAKQCDYKYVWIKHGTILARKSDTSPVIAIKTSADISKFK
ncbi:uncharacterized protein LOC123657198 [Melitaea cinxia]|uniref:uncharacterized protein LOC123657198 n=1 Tax=Melitaea cinxia TaxID=113334 RepID=UPI001E271DE5|nr:uncharacterized protein LOC123657198 [Melitaea cinxia]